MTRSAILVFVSSAMLGFSTAHAQRGLNGFDPKAKVPSPLATVELDAKMLEAQRKFENLVEAIQPERDLSRSPLFQVSFSTLKASADEVQLDDLTVTPFQAETKTSKFDLSFLFVEPSWQGVQDPADCAE